MAESIINAKRFLEDSKILFKENSIGHATSLAILGFEEAHKAYLLIQLLPVMEDYIHSKQRKDVRRQLDRHFYKLNQALSYQVFFQYLTYANASEETKSKLEESLLKMKENRQKLMTSSREKQLNNLKNRGFYVDPFAIDDVWVPTNITDIEYKEAVELLELQITLVQDVIEMYMDPDFSVPDEVHMQMSMVSRALLNSRSKGLSTMRREIEEAGDAGTIIGGFLDFLEKFHDIKGGTHRSRRRK